LIIRDYQRTAALIKEGSVLEALRPLVLTTSVPEIAIASSYQPHANSYLVKLVQFEA
jgi:hypothetical protein